MKYSIILAIIITTMNLFSQVRQGLDSQFNITDNVKNIKYFRLVELKDTLYQCNVYYLTGEIMMIGTYSDKELKIQNGEFKYYFANGNIESCGIYKEGVKRGYWKRWNFDGTKKEDRYYQ